MSLSYCLGGRCRWWVGAKEIQEHKEKRNVEIRLYFNKEFVPNGDGIFVTYKQAYGIEKKKNSSKKRKHITH